MTTSSTRSISTISRFATSRRATPHAPPVPEALTVRAYERHFDVSWAPSAADDLLAYRIYRSSDGKTFEPIGTQQGSRTRFVDFTGEPPREAVYRVTALDLAGNESAPSPVSKRARTRAFTDDELLTMVQEASLPLLLGSRAS